MRGPAGGGYGRTVGSCKGGPRLLPATPVPAQPSATMAAPTPDPTLKAGWKAREVRALQQRLGELGYLNIDEYTINLPGNRTFRASFQRQNGLRRTV